MNFVARGCMYCEGECNKECLKEAAEKLKGRELFKESNDRARKMLSEVKSLPIVETLEEAAEKHIKKNSLYFDTPYEKNHSRVAFIEGAKWQQEQDRWKAVYEETPPIHVELLVKSPEGIVHLASWRESYNIFTCQAKSESSLNWKWKTI